MEYFNKQLCVTFAELTDGTSPVLKASTLKLNVWRGNICCLRRGGGEGNGALYAWSSLPEKYKRRYVELYGDPEEAMKKAMMKDRMAMDARAREFFEGYTYEAADGTEQHLSTKLVEEYTVNASVIAALQKMTTERRQIRSALGSGMQGTWEVVFQSSEKLREAYGHTLPTSLGRLKTKMKAFEQDGYESLVSGKVGNRNTQKITEEFGRLLVALKRSKVPVYTDRQLFEEANRRAEGYGWKPLRSLSGMVRWLNSASVQPLWWDAVHGEQSARQRFGRKMKTLLPTRRDSLWYGDGTKLNLYYRDERGKVRTTQVYEVIDAMSEVLLGYWISDSEDYEAQYHAYRMAIQVSGRKPYEIVHDNQGGHKKLNKSPLAASPRGEGKDGGKGAREKGFLDKLCHVHRATQPYNGESKTIESVFGRFQQQVLHKDWRFTGQNVTARKAASKPNVEFIDANKDKLYTLAELKAAYAKARKEWNEGIDTATGMRRIDRYEQSVNEEAQEVTLWDMVDMFWIFSDQPITMTDQGLTMTIKGVKHTWEVFSEPGVPDHEWRRRHTYEKFTVAYDPYDLTSVRLYSVNAQGGLRFERIAEPYLVIHRALQDQQGTDDAQVIRRELEANRRDRIERTVEGRLMARAHDMDAEAQGLKDAEPKGMDAAAQREIFHRTSRYSLAPDTLELGRVTKRTSNLDWMEESEGSEEGKGKSEKSDALLRRVAGKL